MDIMRHILRAYSRVVINESRVSFKEEGKDFELMRRYQRLIVLEQEVIVDQRIRAEALNSLTSMGDDQWDSILAGTTNFLFK